MSKKINSVDDLVPDSKNANAGTKSGRDFVDKSLSEYGAGRSVLSDKNGNLIAGNKTVESAKKTGMPVRVIETDGKELVVVQRTDLDLSTDEKARKLAYADNRASEIGLCWEIDQIVDDMKNGVDLSDVFSEKDFKAFGIDIDDEPEDDPEPQMDKAEELQAKWGVEKGDVFRIGDHKLMCADFINSEVEAETVDACITDPPYNIAYTGKTKDRLEIQNDSMSDEDFYKFLLGFYKNAEKMLKKGHAIYVFHGDGEGYNFRGAFKESGLLLKQCCIWVKQSLVVGRQDFHWQHEPVLYGWKAGGAHRWFSDRKQTTVWNFDRPISSQLHPTMKPVDLIEYPMECSTEKGDVVLDPFLGSGTTMVACQRKNRKCLGYEIDPKYCAVILERMTDMGLDVSKE